MSKNTVSIREWAEDDRPREKMLRKGKNTLSDAELIAIIIGQGSLNKTAVDLARELLRLANDDLYEFGKLQLLQLCAVKGIGEAKAVAILAAMELGRRRRESPALKKRKIFSSIHSYDLVKSFYKDLLHEEFHIIYLSRASEVLGIRKISMGGTTGTYVDAKMVFKTAMEFNASALILTHNHPSGNCRPSPDDERLTRKLREFGSMIEMPILDHLIITDNGYFSFSDNGLML